VAPLEPKEISQAFRDYMIHVIKLVDRGQVARDLWQTRSWYTTWFYHVSHSVMSHPTEVVEEPPHRPHYKEVIIQEECARELPDPLQVMRNIYDITEEALRYPNPHPYFHNMIMRIQEEIHPVIELHIVRRRMRKRKG